MGAITVLPVVGIGEVSAGDDLASVLAAALTGQPGEATDTGAAHTGPRLVDGDVLVVTQKVVSKAEGRLVPIDPDDPDAKRRLAERESVRVLRRRDQLLITETPQGFVCANGGVDLSNVMPGTAALLPIDSDRSARRIRERLQHILGVDLGVIISDTFGRTWRHGVTDVAIGCAGIAAIVDLRGTADAGGRELVATEVCVADELAGTAELVMGKDRDVPAAIVRGVPSHWRRQSSVASEIIRPPEEDLFR